MTYDPALLAASLNPIARRRFLAGGTALAALAPFAARAQTAAPRPGGTLRLAFASAPDSLDPQRTLAAAGNQLSNMIYDNLTVLDEQGEAQPMLATSWRHEKAAQEWIFELRQGVKFHHGTEFTSADVVASIERAYDKELGMRAAGAFGPILSVRSEGRYSVRLVLSQPLVEIPIVVAGRWARILPADKLDSQKSDPSGTGPFLFREFESGSSVTLVRNPGYWMKGQPYLDGVRLVAIKESVAQQAALRGGSVDIITQIPIETFLSLKGVSGIQTFSSPTGQYQCLTTQANFAPFDNPKVRLAFKYMLDRRLLQASALLGNGVIGNDLPVPPSSPYAAGLPQHVQDLPKARKLLDEAGVKTLDLELYTSSERPPTPKMALALMEAGSKIGVQVKVTDIPFTEYAANVSKKKPFYTVQWSAYPTLYESVWLMYRGGQPWNYGGTEQAPGLDALLDTMISEPDAAKRKEAITGAMAKIHEYGERVIPYFPNYVGAASTKVQGYVPPKYDVIDLRGVWMGA